jgi:hypothetical protein
VLLSISTNSHWLQVGEGYRAVVDIVVLRVLIEHSHGSTEVRVESGIDAVKL